MPIGTISHGTHRPEDLIPAFTSALEELAPEVAEGFRRGNALDYQRIADGAELIVTDRDIVFVPMLVSDLFDALEDNAPEGTYFGAHPGDGSDFGFWPVEFLEV